MSDSNDEKIAKLEAEIEKHKGELAALKAAAKPPPMPTKAECDAWADQMHQAREARANAHQFLSPSQIREMDAACDPATARDLWQHGTVQGPSGHGVSGQVTGVRAHGGANVAGSGTGWAREIELRPPPGVAQADRLMDAQDARDRAALIEQERRLKRR